MLDNTLTGKDALGAKKLLGRSYGPVDRQRIPLIIHVPGQTTPLLRKDVAGQVDIMPTVADMVGVDLSQVPHMGRSLFVASSGLVPLNAYLRGGSFLNNAVLFMPAKGSNGSSARDVSDGSAATPSASDKADLKRVRELVKISDRWVLSLKKFRGGLQDWIPDRTARRAAKPYGFLQAGLGSG
jgi:lipoteichoic acid synthase